MKTMQNYSFPVLPLFKNSWQSFHWKNNAQKGKNTKILQSNFEIKSFQNLQSRPIFYQLLLLKAQDAFS